MITAPVSSYTGPVAAPGSHVHTHVHVSTCMGTICGYGSVIGSQDHEFGVCVCLFYYIWGVYVSPGDQSADHHKFRVRFSSGLKFGFNLGFNSCNG